MKKSKLYLLLLIGLTIGAGSLLWQSLQRNDFLIFPISYNERMVPTIDIKIEDTTYPVELRVGWDRPLMLKKEILDTLTKTPLGMTKRYSIIEDIDSSPTYLIPKISIGDFTLTNVIAIQAHEDEFNSLGKYLGKEMNLLLDFPSSRIIACNSFSKLKKEGLINKQWIPIPFTTGIAGITLPIDTDLGTRIFSLHTNFPYLLLKSSIIPPDQTFTSSIFSIGKRNFGTTLFHPIDIQSDVFHNIDGLIGIDFFKNHAIYFDYTHKIAYIEPAPIYFEHIPVTFNRYGFPCLNVDIQGTTHSLELDLGSYFLLSLHQDILQNINKIDYGTSSWKDFKGNDYTTISCTIPEIKINTLSFADIITKEDSQEFYANVMSNFLPNSIAGKLGRPILEKYNLFLDFQHSAIYASNDHLTLQKKGLLSKKLLKVPFILHGDGIMLSIETDSKTMNLILDTGSNHILIRAPHPEFTSTFRLAGHDFGPQKIFAIDLMPDFEYDGYLGSDFLRENSLFIDYPNKLIYLDLQKN